MALTPAEQAELDALYVELKPQATEAARTYVLSRTPAAWQTDMIAKIDADWPTPPVTQAASASEQPVGSAYYPPSQPVA